VELASHLCEPVVHQLHHMEMVEVHEDAEQMFKHGSDIGCMSVAIALKNQANLSKQLNYVLSSSILFIFMLNSSSFQIVSNRNLEGFRPPNVNEVFKLIDDFWSG
jgi:hypothetical protein